jgi:GDP-4-dehydro-6-deoxy-D-mannose reductase
MRVLVTGIAGFVGPYVAAALGAAGHEVHGAVRSAPPAESAARLGLAPGRFHAADLADARAATDLVRTVAPEGIVHLAGFSFVPAAERDPDAAYRGNLGTMLSLLAAVREAAPRARLVAVTSGHVYGVIRPDELPLDEDRPLRPTSVYEASKGAADLAAGQWARAYGLDVMRVRPFNHTGPGQPPTFVCSALARQIAAVERGAAPVVRVGNMDPVRDFSDVRDVAAGYVALLERGHPGEAYNLCAGAGVSIAEVLAILRTHARVPIRVEVAADLRRAVDVPALVGSHARATRDTGWVPRIGLEDTLGALLEDWRRRDASP